MTKIIEREVRSNKHEKTFLYKMLFDNDYKWEYNFQDEWFKSALERNSTYQTKYFKKYIKLY